ncbi:hypothetical protein HDU76_001365 [Blyttiomyces sp. JEL0837]|nr:hypothetical protein HDU76_001365 [Blyttiomyces sp. JEL0837]
MSCNHQDQSYFGNELKTRRRNNDSDNDNDDNEGILTKKARHTDFNNINNNSVDLTGDEFDGEDDSHNHPKDQSISVQTTNTTTSNSPPPSSCTIFSHYLCLNHRGHEGSHESKGERPERITGVLEAFANRFAPKSLVPSSDSSQTRIRFKTNSTTHACVSQLWRAHSPEYISKLLSKAPPPGSSGGKRGLVHFSPGHSGVKTSFLSSGSLDAIFHAAGVVIAAVDHVMTFPPTSQDLALTSTPTTTTTPTAFCVIRPPGHHCGRNGVESLDTELDLAQGFCFINNVAVGACHAVSQYGARVAIIDFDLHHGNGTEGILRHLLNEHISTHSTSSTQPPQFPLFLASLHQYALADDENEAFFPGTGGTVDSNDIAYTYCLNVPLPSRSGSVVWRDAVRNLVLPRVKEFRPDLIMISAGFDSHLDDEIGELELVDDDYKWIASELCTIQPRIVSVLEGGYEIESDTGGLGSLPRACIAHVEGLVGI